MSMQYDAFFSRIFRAAWGLALLGAGFGMSAHAATVEVQVENFQFSPAAISIQTGDTVRWTWISGSHSVTSGSNCSSNGSFDSGIQSPSFSYSRTFNKPGKVPYFCTPHCGTGMVGTINVSGSPVSSGKVPKKLMLNFQAMQSVNGAFLGEQNPIREIAGADLPRAEAKSVKGQLFSTGLLTLSVQGLVLADDPSVPAGQRGTNDEDTVRGLVSCLTEEDGQVVTKNIFTQAFPASTSGKVTLKATLALPSPCTAPIVMIVSGTEDKWLAITGYEAPNR
jgi:plastocyanin